jgi:excisionase family DNA binding protein
MTKPMEPVQVRSEAIAVLTMQEAATRLGISTGEMEAMVKRGTVRSVVAGWTTMVPTSEVERCAR